MADSYPVLIKIKFGIFAKELSYEEFLLSLEKIPTRNFEETFEDIQIFDQKIFKGAI